MISSTMQNAINEQINREFQNEINYLGMKVWFDKNNWDGFAHWFLIQTQEERSHALKFAEHVTDRNGTVVLDPLEAPKFSAFTSHLDVMEKSLELEKQTTTHINELMSIAINEKDYQAVDLLRWYVTEQIEEEKNFEELITKCRLAEVDKSALLIIDEDLADRQYKAP